MNQHRFRSNKKGSNKVLTKLTLKRFSTISISIILTMVLISTSSFAETTQTNQGKESNNIYLYDSLDIELKIEGGFDLISTDPDYQIKELSANLFIYPQISYQQELIDFSTNAEIENDYLKFSWDNPELGTKYFSLQSKVKTNNNRNEVNKKVPFPIPNLDQYLTSEPQLSQYLEESKTIDTNHPKIIEQANHLADGEDDLFRVIFNLASWVEENIEYDLNELTTDASQKSSWVLENRQGVCDEMTSLFIAMSRSLGVPARFVTGVSYTNSELFSEPWQAHGWAEVYFPEYGWVSFDPTFGEYGYVDVTHVKLKDSTDPTSSSTTYQWVANNVELENNYMDIGSSIVSYGNIIEEELSLELEIINENIGFGSFNLIKAIIKNNYDFYSASTLSLAIPDEIEIIGNSKQNILLEPKEVKELYWIIKTPDNLKENFIYDFPFLIYTEKNITLQDTFKSTQNDQIYTYEDIKKLIPTEEDNSYSRKITLNCEHTEIIKQNQQTEINCIVQNKGNTELIDLNFCIESKCEQINLPINQEYNLENTLTFPNAGWETVLIKIENEFVQKQKYLNIKTLDNAKIEINTTISNNITYGEKFFMTISLSKGSFSTPEDANIIVTSHNVQNKWNIEIVDKDEDIIIEFSTIGMTFNNQFPLEVSWKDDFGTQYSESKVIHIKVQGDNVWDKIVMFFNQIIY